MSTNMSKFSIESEELFKFIGDATQVTIPNNVTEISTLSFYRCKNLTKVEIP